MKNMWTHKMTTWLVATGVFLLASLGSTGALATLVPGIVDPSLPQFVSNVIVRANKGNWNIVGNRDFTFETSTALWSGTNSNYKLMASFDNAGNFVSGSVSLAGKIPGLIDSKQTLMTADVISFGFDAGDPTLIGFNTDNIVCNVLLGVNCTTSESVLVFLDSSFGGDVNARLKTSGFAVTSVPLPAAVWLFGAGVGMLGAVARSKRERN